MDEKVKNRIWTGANQVAQEIEPEDLEKIIARLHEDLVIAKVALIAQRETQRMEDTKEWMRELDEDNL